MKNLRWIIISALLVFSEMVCAAGKMLVRYRDLEIDKADFVYFQQIDVNDIWVLRVNTAKFRVKAKKPNGVNWSYSRTTIASEEASFVVECNKYVFYFKTRVADEISSDAFGTLAKGDIIGVCGEGSGSGGEAGTWGPSSGEYVYDLRKANVKVEKATNAVMVDEYVDLEAFNLSNAPVNVVWSAYPKNNVTFSKKNESNEYHGYDGENISRISFKSDEVQIYTVLATLDEGNVGEASIAVVKPELISVEITSDHETEDGSNLMRLNTNINDWGNEGPENLEPEWVKEPKRNNPVSHTKGVPVSVRVGLNGLPDNVFYTIKAVGSYDLINLNGEVIGERTLNFQSALQLSSTDTNLVPLMSEEPLINNIHIINLSIEWELVISGRSFPLGESGGENGHKFYLTWGTPFGSIITENRIRSVCHPARTLAVKKLCADAIFDEHHGKGLFGTDGFPHGPPNIWDLMKREDKSLCQGLALFLMKNYQMLGMDVGLEDLGFGQAKSIGGFQQTMNPYGPQPQRIIRADGVHHPVDTDHNDVSPAEELWHPGGNKWQAFILYQGFYYAIDVGRTDNKLGDFMTRTFGDPAARWMYKALDEDGEVIYKECEIDPWQAL